MEGMEAYTAYKHDLPIAVNQKPVLDLKLFVSLSVLDFENV